MFVKKLVQIIATILQKNSWNFKRVIISPTHLICSAFEDDSRWYKCLISTDSNNNSSIFSGASMLLILRSLFGSWSCNALTFCFTCKDPNFIWTKDSFSLDLVFCNHISEIILVVHICMRVNSALAFVFKWTEICHFNVLWVPQYKTGCSIFSGTLGWKFTT